MDFIDLHGSKGDALVETNLFAEDGEEWVVAPPDPPQHSCQLE